MNVTPSSFHHFLHIQETFGGGGDDDEDLSFIFDDDEESGVDDESLSRKDRWDHQRVDWRLHCAQLIHEERFAKEYRMSFQAWERLRVILIKHIRRMSSKSRCTEPITVDIIMGMGMRWLAGGKISHDRHTFHVSYTEAYRCCHHFIDGVLAAKELKICFPPNSQEWDKVRNGF